MSRSSGFAMPQSRILLLIIFILHLHRSPRHHQETSPCTHEENEDTGTGAG